MITLYAITDHPAPTLPSPGGTRVVAIADLAAVCGPAGTGDIVTAEALYEHERIVEALMDDRDVLPVRYGTRLPDEAAAARALVDNHDAYAAALEKVRGAVEIAVRVFGADDPPAPGPASPGGRTTGREYLRARARRAAGEADVRALVHEPLLDRARAGTVAAVNRSRELLRAAYLIDRDAVASLSARVGAIQEANPQLRMTCTGPWPPYSFVTA